MDVFMKKNIGCFDRTIRLVVGAVLLYFAVEGYWWGWIGILPLATAIFSYCHLYTLLKISTRSGKDDKKGGCGCCCG